MNRNGKCNCIRERSGSLVLGSGIARIFLSSFFFLLSSFLFLLSSFFFLLSSFFFLLSSFFRLAVQSRPVPSRPVPSRVVPSRPVPSRVVLFLFFFGECKVWWG